MQIKNISFDLWLTLIKSHPQFKRKRAEFIADSFNPKGLSVFEIEKIVYETDKIIDRYNEMTGRKMPATQMYSTIMKRISGVESPDQTASVEKKSSDLFLEYSPELLNSHIPELLSRLKEEGFTLNLASNTGFIEGKTLRVVLERMGILSLFSFCIFSDEINASKPSRAFFQQVYDHMDVRKEQVLHIGDNPKSDYKGASDFGFSALLITTTNYTIHDIKAKL